MSRNGSHRPTTNRASTKRQPPSSGPSSRTWILAILVVLIFAGGVAYLDRAGMQKPSAFLHRALQHQHSTSNKQEPTFEFYTALPSGKLTMMPDNAMHQKQPETPTVSSAVRATTTPSSTSNVAPVAIKVATTANPPKANTNSYFLQVGSFPDYADADELKAQLLLDNFNANIQETTIQDKKWYRVIIGPFHSIKNLNEAQTQLNALHYPALRLQLEEK